MWLCQHNYKTYQSNMVPNKVSIVFISACFVRYSHYCCNKYGTYSTFSSVSFCVCVWACKRHHLRRRGYTQYSTSTYVNIQHVNWVLQSWETSTDTGFRYEWTNEQVQPRPKQTEQSPANPNNRNKPASQWEKKGTRARKQMHLTIRRTAEYDKPRCQGQGKSAVLEINKPG